MAANGVPPRAITVRNYHPASERQFAAIRLIYPKIAAVAGPCGTWPEDLGPSIKNKGYFENKPYWNLGCANQRNLAAMVDNPTDLVQPRPRRRPTRGAGRPLSKPTARPSRIRKNQDQRSWKMISYARQNQDEPAAPAAAEDDHIAPAPRVSVQAFLRQRGNRRGGAVRGRRPPPRQGHLKIQMGGMAAAVEAYRAAPTPT